MKMRAYGKINLTLDVTGKREDGYHLLDTVMQTVSLWDELEVRREREPGIRIFCGVAYLPKDRKNTAYRAAELFFDRCGVTGEGVSISIRKRIPSRAGMGGGSADAAAVLRALNVIYQKKLSPGELASWGAEIGADVPFCVMGGAARCTGVGELLSPVPSLPECTLLLCKPPVGMSTPRAYALIDQFPLTENLHTPKMADALEGGDLRQIARNLGNRFDETMKLDQVREIKKRMLSAGALGAMMTGSGSVVYGIFEEEQKARSCASQLRECGRVFFAHPLADPFHGS